MGDARRRRKPAAIDTYERVSIDGRPAWRRWLASHHAESPGIWLVSWKKPTGKPRMTYDEVVEEALCFGWVDSLPRSLDDERTMLLITPRTPGSGWSAINKGRVERLVAAGLMAPAGMAVVEAAEADGSWSALDASEALEEPDDLADALAGDRAARDGFDAFTASVKKPLLAWVTSAKRPETRARRVAAIVEGAARGQSPLDWRAKRRASPSGDGEGDSP